VLRSARDSIGCSAVFFLAGICFAQVDRSALNGTATDPAGRVIPGIHVGHLPNTLLSLLS